MRWAEVERRLADHLLARQGWARHESRPACLVHAETGLQVQVYGAQLTIILGQDEHDRHDKGIVLQTGHFPNAAIATALEVADALVMKRTVESRRGRPRKGGFGLPAGDMLLLICAQQGAVTRAGAAEDPQWTVLAGWAGKPAVTTVARAANELRAARLLELMPDNTQQLRLTREGWPAAAEVARRLGIPLPDPVSPA